MDKQKLVCVNCGSAVRTLYVQYSPGNIRLMKCEHCKAVADPYIECEFMIILIDLILHKPKAYRHLLYNMMDLKVAGIKGMLWKAIFIYLLLDALRILLLKLKNDDRNLSWSSFMSMKICGEVLLYVILGNIVFISALCFGTTVLLNYSIYIARFKELALAILVSSYFKIYLITMVVWEFPTSVLFIIDIFVLSSNTVAFKDLFTVGFFPP